jgi:hypothetical protein
MPPRRRSRLLAVACGAYLLASCDNAPNKEVDQAEGAAAERTLQEARSLVGRGDYPTGLAAAARASTQLAPAEASIETATASPSPRAVRLTHLVFCRPEQRPGTQILHTT